jgi:hypothetical protein
MYALRPKHAVSRCQRSDAKDQNTKTLARPQLVRCGKQGALRRRQPLRWHERTARISRPCCPKSLPQPRLCALHSPRTAGSEEYSAATWLRGGVTPCAQRMASIGPRAFGIRAARPASESGRAARTHSQQKQRSTTDIHDSWECPGAAAQTSGNVAYL